MQGGFIPQMAAIAWYSPKRTELIECYCNAENGDEAGALSASVSEDRPASRCDCRPSVVKTEDSRGRGDTFAVFSLHLTARTATASEERARRRGPSAISCRAAIRQMTRRTTMSFAIQHVHVKTKDPKQTMQFYIDNLGATYVAEIPGRGHRLNLHGLTLNITTLIS